MKKILLLVLVALAQFVNAQDLYDKNTLREITLKFYDKGVGLKKLLIMNN